VRPAVGEPGSSGWPVFLTNFVPLLWKGGPDTNTGFVCFSPGREIRGEMT